MQILKTTQDQPELNNSKLVTAAGILLQVIIYGVPAALCALPFFILQNTIAKMLLLIAAPLEYGFLYGVTAGLLSKFFQRGIIKGVFPRKTGHPVYAMRKLYGTCWNSLYYFKPVYNMILNVPWFKAVILRLFGYKGSLDITIFPDAWIRDLPLLRIEEGAYIANRVTLGTNICLIDGNVMTGNVTLMKGCMVGHRSIIGLGARVGERSEIGVDCMIGLHVKIGNDSKIGPSTGINHGARIGNNVQIDARSYIGAGAIIGDNLRLPSNISIPDKAEIYTMADVMQYANTDTRPALAVVRDPYYDRFKKYH